MAGTTRSKRCPKKRKQPSLAKQRSEGRYWALSWLHLTPKQQEERRAATAERRRQRQREREAERRTQKLLDAPHWAIGRRVTRALSRAMETGGELRRYREALGYTAAEARAHFESLFRPGMSWENRKAWHIDHIRPLASFRFASIHDPGFRECFALSNLQPLWAVENCYKDAWRGADFCFRGRGISIEAKDPLAYSVQTIVDWANGAKPMSAKQARDIERRLGLPGGWLDKAGSRRPPREG